MEFEVDIRVPSDGKPAKFPPDIPPDKTVQDFLDVYEQKYLMKSEDFFEKWQNSEIEDDPELNEWAGFYKLKLAMVRDGEDPSQATFKRYVPEGIIADD